MLYTIIWPAGAFDAVRVQSFAAAAAAEDHLGRHPDSYTGFVVATELDLRHVPTGALLAVFNRSRAMKAPLKRFSDHVAAVRRTFPVLNAVAGAGHAANSTAAGDEKTEGPMDGDAVVPEPGEGSGQYIKRLYMMDRYTPEQISALTLRHWPQRRTNRAQINWYRRALELEGRNPPPWRRLSRAR